MLCRYSSGAPLGMTEEVERIAERIAPGSTLQLLIYARTRGFLFDVIHGGRVLAQLACNPMSERSRIPTFDCLIAAGDALVTDISRGQVRSRADQTMGFLLRGPAERAAELAAFRRTDLIVSVGPKR